ncbi:MAG: hypothetical protein GY874_12145 [Desulfobacteraceae bacterium]|nr:hypothetical protein [Desulfobacteraceae bacterium]
MLGLIRFAILVIITIMAAAVVLAKYQQILNLMWTMPENVWLIWLWHVTSWLLALLLIAICAVLGFVTAQVLFCVVIVDYMSQVTEKQLTGRLKAAPKMSWPKYVWFLMHQEIPRTIVPILIALLLLVLSWFTPLGPVMTLLSPLAAAVFLAWDNTDLIPARRLVPFNKRVDLLRRYLWFHVGFGLPLLIPFANIVLISFAPVGATLFYVERIDKEDEQAVPG